MKSLIGVAMLGLLAVPVAAFPQPAAAQGSVGIGNGFKAGGVDGGGKREGREGNGLRPEVRDRQADATGKGNGYRPEIEIDPEGSRVVADGGSSVGVGLKQLPVIVCPFDPECPA
jgi:hypothetical protein